MSVSSPTVARPVLGQELAYSGRQNRLYNSMIDVTLVYGIDETTCRSLDMNERESIQEVYDFLLQKDVKLRFLQILAPGKVYPPKTKEADSYPPDTHGPSHKRKFRIEDFGLAWETVDTLHFFMYPDGVQMYAEDVEPSMLPLMLTNVEGSRSYAVGLKFSRPFFIERNETGRYVLTPWTYTNGFAPSQCKLIYLPACVVMVSSQPFYNFMKEALSGLYRLTSVDDKEINFWEVLQDFSEKMFLIPTIPEGSMGLEIHLPGFSSVTRVMPPRQSLYLDIRLDFPFRFLSVDDILTVIGALLNEQRILIFSSQYNVPGIFIQCILSYIQPFQFRHPIVSILPKEQLELLGAVGTNIMGCHSDALDTPEFGEVDEAVLVYLDEGKVECRILSDYPLYPLPAGPTQRFKFQYEYLVKSMQYEIESLERLTLGSAAERESVRFYFHHFMDTKLLELFLELMVRVYSDITDSLRDGRAVFEANLKKMCEADRLFYRQVTQTDMFSVFLVQRRHNQRDSFNILADQIKLNEKKGSITSDDISELQLKELMGRPKHRQSRLRGTIVNPLADDRLTPPIAKCLHGKVNFYKDLQFLEMPIFEDKPLDRSEYIQGVLSALDYMSQDKDNKSVCTYLSAHYKIAKGHVMEGLDEFCETLQLLNTSLVPSTNDLVEFMALLNFEEKDLIMEKSYYKQLLTRGTSYSQNNRHMTIVSVSRPSTNGRVVRRRPLMYNNFLSEVQQESIARDAESASNLFSVLQTVGQSATVTPDLFQVFLDSWTHVLNENENITNEVHLNPPSHEVPERVLASSNDLKCNFTQHCTVVLTTHRLIILSQAGWRERTFANLSELELGSFSKCEIALQFLGAKTPVIKQEIVQDPKRESSSGGLLTSRTRSQKKNKTDPYLGFPNELLRDIWYRIIKEVISGWKIIFNRRDPSVMDEVECHVKMMMALYQTGWMQGANSATKLKIAQKLLSFHSKPISDISEATDALQYRINPNIHQTEKATIESTLFVSSDICGGQGKLMLGMGTGMLRVYDMEARCFESDLKIVDSRRRIPIRITCLLLVDFHVWVGRLGRTIHILDVETLCHVSQLPYLDDDPRDMCLSQSEPKIVWTLLLNGILLGFDPESRQRVVKIQVPNIDTHSFCSCFTVWKDHLWVGTNRGRIAVINTRNYSCEREIKLCPQNMLDKKQVEIKCLAVSSEEEVWCSVHTVPRCAGSTYVTVFNPRNGLQLYTFPCPDSNHRISFILPFKHTVWCGTKCGKIYVFSARTENNQNGPKILSAHDDKIRSMAATDTDFVISGTGSNDGYANVWKLMDWFND